MDLAISPIAIALASANCLWIMYRAYAKRRNDRHLAAMNAQMQNIATAVVPSKESLDTQIEKAFEDLLAHPSEELYRKIIELASKRQEELFAALQFSSVDEFIQKRKAISDLMAEMLTKLDEVLLEKGIATQTPAPAGAGTGLNESGDAAPQKPAGKGSIQIVESVAPKKSCWLC
jgi:predicted membrane-bound spermidine synthase